MRWLLVTSLLLIPFLSACTEQADGQPAKPASTPKHLVELVAVIRDTIRTSSVYTGSLRARRSVRIFTQEEGRITSLPFYEGDGVAKDQIVLELDDRLLKAQMIKATVTRRQAETNLERLTRLRKQNLISEDDYIRGDTILQVAAAEESVLRTRIGYTRVAAPFAGVVTYRGAEPGDFVERNSHVLTIADPSSLIAELMVSEMVLPHVLVGDPVEVQIDALGTSKFAGRVLRTHPELDARTRQGRVEVELQPIPDRARAGQFARVRFQIEAFDRIVIPFAALRRDRDGEFVYRVGGEQVATRVAVRSGGVLPIGWRSRRDLLPEIRSSLKDS
ncbi:MAG: efflux RND transporter periplasmic adaptor subunit [Gammaproteobacteria bacterium]|nr:efflux RND transporter periplasmic adaptor subunit [Gammaproteobacteria bacterium]